MKKFLFLILCLLFTSCNDAVVHMDGWASPVNSNDKKIDVSLYEYDGHTYLIFGFTQFTSGVVHDPNCICNLKKEY